MKPTHQHQTAVLVFLVLATCLCAAACRQPSGMLCGLNADPERLGLCIDNVTFTLSGDRTVAIQARIANVAEAPSTGRVWWVLAPLGSGAPWDRAIFVSRPDVRTYGSHQNIQLTWDTPVAVPSGLYDIALLVHVVHLNGSETHADAREIGPIRIAAPLTEPWLVRSMEGPGPARVMGASSPLPDPTSPNPFSRDVTVQNQGTSTVDISVLVEVRALMSGWEDKWWKSILVYSAPSVTTSLPNGQSKTVRVESAAPPILLASFPAAQFWIAVTVNNKVADEVLLGGAATFRAVASVSLSRRGPPTGPIEVTGITTAGKWAHRTTGNVILTLTNLTGATRAVRAWWYFAAVGDQQPWTDWSGSSIQAQTTLAPWATATITIRTSKAKVGQWELSAWVHAETKPGAFAQTDAMWLPEKVTVS